MAPKHDDWKMGLVRRDAPSSEQPLAEIDCSLITSTMDALCVDIGDTDKDGRVVKYWVPRSHVYDWEEDEHGNLTQITMPEWSAIQKGLV